MEKRRSGSCRDNELLLIGVEIFRPGLNRTRSSMNFTSRDSRSNPNSGVHHSRAGTYAGLVEKIPYLKDLGITVVELMPVFQRDPHGG